MRPVPTRRTGRFIVAGATAAQDPLRPCAATRRTSLGSENGHAPAIVWANRTGITASRSNSRASERMDHQS
jgi:hypothetical protein